MYNKYVIEKWFTLIAFPVIPQLAIFKNYDHGGRAVLLLEQVSPSPFVI